MTNEKPSLAADSVLKPSDPIPSSSVQVDGLDFNQYAGRDITVAEMLSSMTNMGFQASNLGKAVDIVDRMVSSREE